MRAINVNIETFHGNVYLMGTARTEHELQRAAEIASTTPGVRRVVSFMRVIAPHQQAFAGSPLSTAPPRPEYRGDEGQAPY